MNYRTETDTFPTAMHIAAYQKIVGYTIPQIIKALKNTLPHLSGYTKC
jgi:fumarate hydratase class II